MREGRGEAAAEVYEAEIAKARGPRGAWPGERPASQRRTRPAVAAGDELVRVENMVKHFPVRTGGLVRRTVGQVHAVDDVSLSIPRGKTLGLVGETGSGKSTLARCVAGLIPVTSGRVIFDGRDITNLSRGAMRPIRREVQMIFQDPTAR